MQVQKRTQANRRTNLARDLHARHTTSRLALSYSALGEDSRVVGLRQTSSAYNKQAVALGYSHVSTERQAEDAKDGGQSLFDEYILIDLTSVVSCVKLLRLVEKPGRSLRAGIRR